MDDKLHVHPIVKDIKLSPADLLIEDEKENSKIKQYYKKILANDFHTDADAAQFFYNDKPSNSSYKSLKQSLREKLVNTLFFFKLKEKPSDFTNAIFYCSKNLLAVKLLVALSARNAGMDLCQRVLKKALEVEYTEYIVAASRELRMIAANHLGDLERFNYYNEIYIKHKGIFEAEMKAEEYYYSLVLPYAKSKEKRNDTHELAKQYHQQLSPFLKKYTSPRLHIFARNIEVTQYLAISDHEIVIKLCKKAQLFFQQKQYTYHVPIRIFSHIELVSCIQLKNYHQGKEAAENAISVTRYGGSGWYFNQELYLMLTLHSKEYNQAYQILDSVINNKSFSQYRQHIKEKWEIYKVYIDFLIYIKKITIVEKKRFRLGKFLNSVPVYSKDKRGLNIPILIAQILFMIVKKDYDQAIDRFEAIKKYTSRYVSKNTNLRSNCFINMLLQVPNASFHKAAVVRKAQKYYDMLLATPLDVAGQSHEIEIIPYEDLWEFILESLETKRHDRR